MMRLALAVLLLPIAAFSAPAKLEKKPFFALSARAEKHIREGHTIGGRNTRGKSVFNDGVDLQALLAAAEGAKPKRERNGRDKRVVDAGKPVGTDGRSGKLLRTYVVISEPDGTVVTMYPGR